MHRTIYSNSERSELFLVTKCFFNLFLDVSHTWQIRTIIIKIGKKYWDLDTCTKSYFLSDEFCSFYNGHSTVLDSQHYIYTTPFKKCCIMWNPIGPLFFRYLFIKGTVCVTQSPCSWNCFIYFRIHLARICTFAGMSGFQQLQCSMPAHPSCAFCDWFNIWKAALWKDRTIRMLLASARPGWASTKVGRTFLIHFQNDLQIKCF